jgi:8-oxo-dGTP pyrophosphatase MutT (NUDIX family)
VQLERMKDKKLPPEPGFLRHFSACNRHDLSKFAPFYIDGTRYGWVSLATAEMLPAEIDGFVKYSDGIALADNLKDYASRSETFAKAAKMMSPIFERKLRKEMYPIVLKWEQRPLAELDRAAVPWFGVKGFGVHVNGFVRKKDGIHIWIGHRSGDRLIDPGKMDNMIGGGQPIGLTLEENVCKEAAEEAGIGEALARTAKQVSTVSYLVERHKGLRNDTLFVYDLEVRDDFEPRNTDGEVDHFELLPIAEVAEIVRTTNKFKFNCNLVITDFLIRHGYLGSTDPEYAALKKELAQ